MKLMSGVLMSLVLMSATMMSCEEQKVPVKEFSFAEIIPIPAQYVDGRPAIFNQGTVVYKIASNSVGVAVVAPVPLPKVNPEDLLDQEIMAIKLPTGTYDSLAIGDIVTAKGILTFKEHEQKTYFYVDASAVLPMGRLDITDPDFEAISQVIASHSADNNDFMADLIGFWLILELTGLSPFNLLGFGDDD